METKIIIHKYNKIKFIILIIFIIFIICNKKIKVGVIGLEHSQNCGNNLLKYSIFIEIKKLGYDPYIVGMRNKNVNISFIQNHVQLRLIKNSFQEINKKDYDILMVNSDQTWRKYNEKYFYDIAFLKFANKWNIPKFVYAASLGMDKWNLNKKDEEIAKFLLKNFTGISVREKGSVKVVESHLGIKPIFVLDPTFLIARKYYLQLIKNYKNDILIDDNYIFVYTLTNSIKLKRYINKLKEATNYKIYLITIKVKNQIEKFIYGINKAKAVITDSFHGTLFSIIFDKPFISFISKGRGNERFNSLKEVFGLGNRIFDFNSTPDFMLLTIKPNLNKTLLKSLKKQSIKYFY
jgi:vacuolar-type H+-ATPase subunit F/Vma7